MEQRLSLVTLGVSNIAESRQFYERLGWRASSIGGDEVAFFQLGGIVLGLYGLSDLASETGLTYGNSPATISLAHNVRDKGDVDTVLDEAERAGATILKQGEEKVWGGYSGYFADPDGYPWEVAWNPGFAIKDDGSIELPS